MSCSLMEQKHEDTDVQENLNPSVPSPDTPQSDQNQAVATQQVADLLCFDDITQEASCVDEKDPLPLGTATSNEAAIAESILAGGLDLLKPDSLYDEASASRTNQNQMEATARHEAFFTQQQEQPSVLNTNSTAPSGNPFVVEQTMPSHPAQNSSLI
ncbi:hypothetical protein SLEP1_g28566 [Rubroshorea leprosula]|uniref:Uncharacterized protein n=1 Tax=Rubroshorea leprosula TaxID=152421 RepID=A0AAV5JU19_9ROSI|nr:hypothetical protein SLEP1_g28566 [Rubroshorea leprosula]